MSNQVLPSLPGLSWNTKKKPIFKTTIREASSGREYRGTSWSTPRWEYTLSYEFLRQGMGRTELTQLLGFFNKHRGAWDSWLYQDPDDNAATLQQFATGDGTTVTFQLVRDLGGFLEPVYDINGTPLVYVQDWQGVSLCSTSPRTNTVLYSEQFQQTLWNKGGTGVTPDYGASPTGASNSADRLYEGSGTSYHYINQEGAGLFDATLPTTVSMYVKPNGRTSINLYMFDGPTTSYVRASFDLSAGTVLGTQAAGPSSTYLSSSCTKFSNGWCHVTLTGIPGSNTSPATKQIQLRMLDGGGAESYTGDGTSGVLLWGAQIEQTSVAGRYIGTTSSVSTLTDYSLGSLGVVSFTQAPVTGALLKWSGSYYWRCRFSDDYIEPSKFMKDLFDLRQLKFITVKP